MRISNQVMPYFATEGTETTEKNRFISVISVPSVAEIRTLPYLLIP